LEVGEGGELERILGMVGDEMFDNLGLSCEAGEEGGWNSDSRLEDEGLESSETVVKASEAGPGVMSPLLKTRCSLFSPVGILKEGEKVA
jgi:hypothetical protein